MTMNMQYCPNCKEATIHEKEKTNHVVHFIMTLLIFPWVLVWILRWVSKKFKCQKCGCVN